MSVWFWTIWQPYFPSLETGQFWSLCLSRSASVRVSTKEQSVKRSHPSVFSQILSKSDANFLEVHDECAPPRPRKRKKDYPRGHLSNLRVQQSLSHAKKVRPQKPFAIVQNGRHYALSEKWGTAILCGSQKNGEKSHWPGLRQIDSSIDFPCTAAVHRSLLWLHWPISEKK